MTRPRGPKRADLVLSGGGVKGIGLVGAVVALMDAGYTAERVSGTSAGSIVGAIVAAASQSQQMTSAEVKDLALSLDYRKFLDPGPIERVPLHRPVVGGCPRQRNLPRRLRARLGAQSTENPRRQHIR